MKRNKRSLRSLIVVGGGRHERVLIDELMSGGRRSVLGVTNAVLEVDEILAGLMPSMANVPGG